MHLSTVTTADSSELASLSMSYYTECMDFHGVKIAILVEDNLIVFLRDNRANLFNANMWDFPGGGREGDESPIECAIREVHEELSLTLSNSDIAWQKTFPAQKDPNQRAYFMVAAITADRVNNLTLQEGQKWRLMSVPEFLSSDDVIPALKERFRVFLDSQESSGIRHKK
jgi:8-oxo-dGTP diphosphatase